jgi:DNA-binding Xre family transcriptional regulator
MIGDLDRLVRESGKPHRVIAAAANCTEATLNRILRGRVRTCKLDTLEAIAAALGYEVKLVRKGNKPQWAPDEPPKPLASRAGDGVVRGPAGR